VINRDQGNIVVVDGRNNFGTYVGQKALEIALQRVETHGLAWVGVHGSNHFGIAATSPCRR